jgi:hypothetical protein
MARKKLSLLVALVMLMVLLIPISSASSQTPVPPIRACASGAFSTEEDFVAAKEQFDGSPYISDGDMLSFTGQVCLRNRQLLAPWFAAAPGPDLGLDALDIFEIDKPTIAFSTEIDDPAGRFTSGDLLFTTGRAIPNIALVTLFGINWDIGLDGVQFVGELGQILKFVDELASIPRESFIQNPTLLRDLLNRFAIDIWFSVEGTAAIGTRSQVLDGDLLSAATGIIVAPQAALLPVDVPAGLPQRGVDFGLDGVAAPRNREQALNSLFFSTEILYAGDKTSFTDGDVLLRGDGVIVKNWELIKNFSPKADFLGLDALSLGPGPGTQACENQITDLGGLQVDVADINGGGRAEIGYPTDHPFGASMPFWGTICNDVNRFRVVFRKAADGLGAGAGIPVLPAEGWQVKQRNPITGACTLTVPWASDADGWYDGPTFRSLLFCNPNLILTNWKTASAPDPNTLYRVWLEFDRGGGIETEPSAHLVRLDNRYPDITDLGIPGGACTTYSAGDMPIMVQGAFADEHFWYYQLSIAGDLYPDHSSSAVRYYDATPAAAHLNGLGTTPAGLQDLHQVTVFDLSPTPKRCAYAVRLWVTDRTIDGYFNPAFNLIGGSFRTPASRSIFFDYAP